MCPSNRHVPHRAHPRPSAHGKLHSVLAGLFFVIGLQALASNGITLKLLYLFRDSVLVDPAGPLARPNVRRKMLWFFVALELLVFAAPFAIKQTIPAIGFPIVIIISILFRTFVMPRWFRDAEWRASDAPTAGAFVMETVGGAYGENGENGDDEDEDEGSGSGNTTPRVESDESAVVDDAVERGEGYDLKDRLEFEAGAVGRGAKRSTGVERGCVRPDLGIRRRSRSTRRRPVGRRE